MDVNIGATLLLLLLLHQHITTYKDFRFLPYTYYYSELTAALLLLLLLVDLSIIFFSVIMK